MTESVEHLITAWYSSIAALFNYYKFPISDEPLQQTNFLFCKSNEDT